MIDILSALCLALALEGIAYAAFPEAMRRTMALVATLPPATLRRFGLSVAVVAIGLLWLARSALITP